MREERNNSLDAAWLYDDLVDYEEDWQDQENLGSEIAPNPTVSIFNKPESGQPRTEILNHGPTPRTTPPRNLSYPTSMDVCDNSVADSDPKLQQYETDIKHLKDHIDALTKQNIILVKNISRLFLTAKKELQYKNECIRKLREDLKSVDKEGKKAENVSKKHPRA